METFVDQLSATKKLVWPEIEAYLSRLTDFPDFCAVPASYNQLLDYHSRLVSEYPKRMGKYLRPTLLLLTAQAMGYPLKTAIKTAAAMQVSEDWILNHDDIEDDSLFRRGLPALHRLYGPELAINAGDGLHILMWKILIDNFTILDHPRAQAILDEFYLMLNRTVFGQTVEIKWTRENKLDLTQKDILLILESKTGYYTIAGPMRLGAILAGANSAQLAAIYKFGRYLGYSFQIIDDLLDLTSDFAGQKKQTGNDIYEGKRTVILSHLLEHISGRDQKKLLSLLKSDRSQKTPADITWTIDQMKLHGSLDYAAKEAKRFAQLARQSLNRLTFLNHQPYRLQLDQAIDFIINRDH